MVSLVSLVMWDFQEIVEGWAREDLQENLVLKGSEERMVHLVYQVRLVTLVTLELLVLEDNLVHLEYLVSKSSNCVI